MLEQIVAKALEAENEAASRITLAQSQCAIEEMEKNQIAEETIIDCQNHLHQDLLKTIEIQEKNNKEKLQLYVRQQEEELKNFLTNNQTKIQKVSQNICDLICTSILDSGENSSDA